MRYAPFLAVFVPLTAFAADGEPAKPATNLANPASQFCVTHGGTLEIRTEANGEVGYCHLPDGRVVEEWTYLREEAVPQQK
ncbi:DUF333 domain-containing protein [Acuticoccus sp. MNP-M23]|uniref:putative hemolysin n=1 Tax=Acuticoccus sp. MNP-M23 TaxID=3072793 RepID=UPI002815E60F|nr:DUF333 domain-containing protein [Acuticoccus sp. MNP-M23]WMS44253.1 DUF333 domain-containing protein [Acuticoccus sp. MNP-M23]